MRLKACKIVASRRARTAWNFCDTTSGCPRHHPCGGTYGRSFALIARLGGIGAGSVASNRSRAALAIASHSPSLKRRATKSRIISINRSCSSGSIASNSQRWGARISANLRELTRASGLSSSSLSTVQRPDRLNFFLGLPARCIAISNLRLAWAARTAPRDALSARILSGGARLIL